VFLIQLLPCLIFLACLSSLLIPCGLAFSPPSQDQQSSQPSTDTQAVSQGSFVERFIYVENWRNKRFVIWALATPCALFGYFVPFVHLVQFAKNIPLDSDESVNGQKAAFLMACIGITSGLGRLFFGWVSDLPALRRNGNRILLQQVKPIVNVTFICLLLIGCILLHGGVHDADDCGTILHWI